MSCHGPSVVSSTEIERRGLSTPSQKRRFDSGETLPELRTITQQGIPAVMVVAPHARAMMEEGYPDAALSQHQLGLVNEAVLAEIDKISSGPVPEFREATVRMGAIIVAAEKSFSKA